MQKKAQNLKPDTVLKNYWRNNERFADLFNAVLFKGRQFITPDELEDLDTEESSVLEHREYAESIQASRDGIKIRKKSLKHGVELVMLGQENQEHIHYAMPMRVMGYDYGTYKKQYESNAKKYTAREGLDEDEFLSKMRKDDRLTPVITVVVYYGEKPWDGATSLHEMLDIPDEMAKYVNDYKILLVEARRNDLVFHNMNNRDLFNLLEIILDKGRPLHEIRSMAIEYAQEHKVDNSVVMTVVGATNSRINYDVLFKKGDADMCTVFEATWEEGMEQGLKKGLAQGIIEMGYDFGLTDDEILKRLQDKLNVPSQKAQEYLGMFTK